jgi:hypothetical protein
MGRLKSQGCATELVEECNNEKLPGSRFRQDQAAV